jgi:hypothetical protein
MGVFEIFRAFLQRGQGAFIVEIRSIVPLALAVTGLVRDSKVQACKVVLSDGLEPFKVLIRTNRVIIEEVMQRPVRNDFETNPVRQLNTIVDRAGPKLAAQSRRQMAGSTSVEYKLDTSIAQWIN